MILSCPWNKRIPPGVSWVLLILGVGAAVHLGLTRYFDQDELEHLHAAWCISKGLVPYKDFFEHHTPGYHYLIGQFFRFFSVETDWTSALRFFTFARIISLLAACTGLGLVFLLGKLWYSTSCGVVAVILLASAGTFHGKMIETRPDVFAFVFIMAGFIALTQCISVPRRGRLASTTAFLLAGFFFGCAIMFTQKALFILPGLGIGLGAYAFCAGENKARVHRVFQLAVFSFCTVVPSALTFA